MKPILFFIGLFMISSFGYAQQFEDDNSAIINAYFKQSIPKTVTPSTTRPITQIRQEGNDNYVEARTNSQQSLNVSQIGNQNYAALMSFFSTTALNLTILQNGNNNGIHIFGENDLIKNAVIRQDASNQHIIITNY